MGLKTIYVLQLIKIAAIKTPIFNQVFKSYFGYTFCKLKL